MTQKNSSMIVFQLADYIIFRLKYVLLILIE